MHNLSENLCVPDRVYSEIIDHLFLVFLSEKRLEIFIEDLQSVCFSVGDSLLSYSQIYNVDEILLPPIMFIGSPTIVHVVVLECFEELLVL